MVPRRGVDKTSLRAVFTPLGLRDLGRSFQTLQWHVCRTNRLSPHQVTHILKNPHKAGSSVYGPPDRIRTCDQWLRKPLLYPAELQAGNSVNCYIPRGYGRAISVSASFETASQFVTNGLMTLAFGPLSPLRGSAWPTKCFGQRRRAPCCKCSYAFVGGHYSIQRYPNIGHKSYRRKAAPSYL